MRSFLFAFIIALGLWYTSAQCPPDIVIQPCTCGGTKVPVVQCRNITDMEVLVGVFKRSGDRRFKSFALFDSSIQYLPATAIAEKRFNLLILYRVSMSTLFDDLPYENNEISIISLRNVMFQRGVGWEYFKPMKKLGLMDVLNTEIRTLDKNFTDNINRGIRNFRLHNTDTKKIQYNAFAQLRKLFNLEIVNSEIKFIQRSMFANPSALEQINFSGNQIETLPDDIFSHMPVLNGVYLENNKLTTVSEAVFSRVYNRPGWIYLSGNPLTCDCKMKWFVFKETGRVSGHCAGPEDQKGKNIPDMKKKDLEYCEEDPWA